MLQSLSVKNFILIDELEIEFEVGLCVITGETGAGKSILLDAILFSLGGKFSDDIIRPGSDYCSVTTIFTLNDNLRKILEQFNIEYDGELLIKRIQKLGNRKKFLINDQVVTQNTLQQIAQHLFELHGQNNHTKLLSPASHLNILDDYADLLGLKSQVNQYYDIYQELNKETNKIRESKDALEKEIDYLTFIIEELTNLDIQEGEEEKLINIRRNLQMREKDLRSTQEILSYLENPNLSNLLHSAQRLIRRHLQQNFHEDANENFSAISANLEDCDNSLEEARIKLQNIINKFEANEFNIEEIEERLFTLRAKARKYNISCDLMPQFLEDSRQQLKILRDKINNAESLDNNRGGEYQEYCKLASILSQKRSISAKKLEIAMSQELAQLKMEKAVFKVEITPKSAITPKSEIIPKNNLSPHQLDTNIGEKYSNIYRDGLDNVRFLAATNPGMKLAPIDKIASGGELSRFMLAVKTCLFDKLLLETIIFDEIDTGIGGMVADKIGERLKHLSILSQVIAITHQPQVVGKADQHILVSKIHKAQDTKVIIKTLNTQERQAEIARMISGKSITEASLSAAKELLISGGR